MSSFQMIIDTRSHEIKSLSMFSIRRSTHKLVCSQFQTETMLFNKTESALLDERISMAHHKRMNIESDVNYMRISEEY